MKYDIIISINIHENPSFLLDQLQNLIDYIHVSFKVILNCNHYMFEQLKHIQLPSFVDIYPVPLEKNVFHGSLTQGIYRNMNYAVDKYDFDYFLVMSSREFFYRPLNNVSQILDHYVTERSAEWIKLGHWHWPTFRRSLLFQYIEANNMIFGHSMHEGLCIRKDTCVFIIQFLTAHPHIKADIFNFDWCVEEFALQTIACNHHGFYYIGNGCQTLSLDNVIPDRFTHKRPRPSS